MGNRAFNTMFQQVYQPHPALKGFVNNIMIHQVKFDESASRLQFAIPPLPEHSLFFYVRDRSDVEDIATHKKQTQSPSLIVGPNVNRHSIRPGRDHLMIKVGFQSGGLYRLLGIPMTELLCQDAFDGVDLLGKEMDDVTDVRRQMKVDKGDENEKRQFSKLFHSNHLGYVQFNQKISA